MKKLAVAIALVLLSGVSGYAVDDLTVLWEKQPAIADGQKVRSSILRFDGDKNQIVLLSTMQSEKDRSKSLISLIRYDITGNIVSQSELSTGDPNENTYFRRNILDVMPISNTLDLGIGLEKKNPSYMVIKYKNEKFTFVPQMQVRDIQVFKILALPDQCFLLIGQGEKGVARMTKVTQGGAIVWEKQYDLDQVEYLYDGVVAEDSSLFVVGGSLKYKNSVPVPETSKIWILHLDGNGNILNEKLIAGDGYPLSSPKICSLTSHGIILSYDKQPDRYKAELVVRNLTYTFEDKWIKDMSSISVVDPGRHFMVKSSETKKGVVVLLSRLSELELIQIDTDGNIIGNYVKKDNVSFSVESMACSDGKVFISTIDDYSKRNGICLYAIQLN